MLSSHIVARLSGVRSRLRQSITARRTALSNKVVMGIHNSRNQVSENIFGIRLLRPSIARLTYILVFAAVLACLLLAETTDIGTRFLHPENANEAVIGAATVMLALFVPVAIALIEDARGSRLYRQVIVKSIISLGFMPYVLAASSAFLFVPLGVHLFGESGTLRTLWAAVVVCGLAFILLSLYRAYRWLSDGIQNYGGPDGPNNPPEDDPNPHVFPSYRFAQIVRLLDTYKGHETWFLVWEQWFPMDYEKVLHEKFIKRETRVLERRQVKRYIVLSVELEAYLKNIKRRNVESWLFYMDYLGKFFTLNMLLQQVFDEGRTEARINGLWRGERALNEIIKRIIYDALDKNKIWHVFDTIDKYIAQVGILSLPAEIKRLPRNEAIEYFIEQYFEALYSGRISSYDVEHYTEQHDHWHISFEGLYGKRYYIAWQLADKFIDWLFKKIHDDLKREEIYKADEIIRAIYPTADIPMVSELYWFMYHAQSTTKAKEALDYYLEAGGRPFGLSSHVYTTFGDDPDRVGGLIEMRDEHMIEVAKIFGNRYRNYFLGFWKLPELIREAKLRQRRKKTSEREKARLEALINYLGHIQTYYDDAFKVDKKKK